METNPYKMNTPERNAWFAALTPEQKRVEIAKDVILQMNVGKYTTKGGYFNIKDIEENDFVFNENLFMEVGDTVTDLQQILVKPEVVCQVCGIGAVFASKVLLGDNCLLNREDWQHDFDDLVSTTVKGKTGIVRQLDGIFTSEQLDLIEACFEEDIIHATRVTQDVANASKMYPGENRNTRMISIMQNIIDNNGTFVVNG